MKYGALFGWGIAIYAIMFLVWSGFVTYGFVEGLLPRIAGGVTLVALSALAGNSLRFQSWTDILPYSLAWMLMIGLLDIVFTVPITGWVIFADWNVWIGYAIIALAPLAAPALRRRRPGTPVA